MEGSVITITPDKKKEAESITLNVTPMSPAASKPVTRPSSLKEVNFGPGIDLLMNPKKKSDNSLKSDIDINELTKLDRDLKNLTKHDQPVPPPALKVGEKTAAKENVTWDGFKKFNEIPVNPTTVAPAKPPMAKEEIISQKLNYLRKLEALEKKGVRLTKKYNIEHTLVEMKTEYEMIKNEKERQSSVKFQGKMLMAFVSAIEFLNSKFDPFDLKLDGWGEAVNENIDEYDDVFGELHQKYGSKAKMAPELKLLFMLGGSAAMLHMTNTMFKSSIPGMDDIMRQNPDLMHKFTEAAVNSMGPEQQNFKGFMNNVMGGGPPLPRQPQTKRNFENDSRPDLSASRKEMKGPRGIDTLLSGIKTKTINISDDKNSTISAGELREMKRDMKQKTKRRPKSERNTVHLNI